MIVFNPISYEGEIDFESIKDPIEKKAVILQIQEFGQIPRQLFIAPHPSRNSPASRKSSLLDSGINEDRFRSPASFRESNLSQLLSHSDSMMTSILSSPGRDSSVLERRTSQFGAQTLAVTLKKQITLCAKYTCLNQFYHRCLIHRRDKHCSMFERRWKFEEN